MTTRNELFEGYIVIQVKDGSRLLLILFTAEHVYMHGLYINHS